MQAIETSVTPSCPFTVGQLVNWRSYTDCNGNHHEAISGMRVERIEHIKPTKANPYAVDHFRLVATKDSGPIRYVEGATRFFDPA